ncbi:unnamed protein product, partial [marine sediment metagenome]
MTDYDLNQFIQFGKILTKSERKNLVAYIDSNLNEEQQKTEDDFLLRTPMSGIYFKQVDTFVKSTEIRQICQNNKIIRNDTMKRLLKEFEIIHDKTNLKGPFVKEELELWKWTNKDVESLVTDSEILLESINNSYSSDEFNFVFFKKEFSSLNDIKMTKTQEKEIVLLRKEALKKEVLERWKKGEFRP